MQRRPAEKLRAFRQEKGLSQAEIAKNAGVSQATVSRRERKPPQRHSDANVRLCSYADKVIKKRTIADQRAIKKSFDEVWNKSEAHAAALSRIIEAFALFCGSERGDEEEPSDK